MQKKKVAIIGAGPAGLTAAHALLSRTSAFDVTVFEESRAIGGISRTVCHHGNRMDIGGHRFFSKDQAVMDWWAGRLPLQGAPAKDDLLLHREKPLAADGPDPEREDRVMLVRNRVSRIYFAAHFFDYPLKLKPATLWNLGLWRTLGAGCSYLRAQLWKRPEANLEDFYINRFGRVLYSMFFEAYTEKVWGRHPRQLNADWGAQRVKGLSVFALLWDSLKKAVLGKQNATTETSLIEEFRYPKYGPGQLWETVAEEVVAKGGRLLREHSVRRIVCADGAVTALVCDTPQGRQEFAADIVISSMPLKDLVQGIDGIAVPEKVQAIARGLPYRDFITIGLLVDRLRLKNLTKIKTIGDIVPDCWIYVQEPGVKVGRLQIFNNWSPYMVRDLEHTVWVGMEYFCCEGDAFWELSDKERIDFAIDEMVKMHILDRGDVKDCHSEKVKKAYPAYFDTYDDIATLKAWLLGIDGLYCVGRNGQHRYNNMDHSMLTAFATVNAILDGVPKEQAWDVNSEQEYHESNA